MIMAYEALIFMLTDNKETKKYWTLMTNSEKPSIDVTLCHVADKSRQAVQQSGTPRNFTEPRPKLSGPTLIIPKGNITV